MFSRFKKDTAPARPDAPAAAAPAPSAPRPAQAAPKTPKSKFLAVPSEAEICTLERLSMSSKVVEASFCETLPATAPTMPGRKLPRRPPPVLPENWISGLSV